MREEPGEKPDYLNWKHLGTQRELKHLDYFQMVSREESEGREREGEHQESGGGIRKSKDETQ